MNLSFDTVEKRHSAEKGLFDSLVRRGIGATYAFNQLPHEVTEPKAGIRIAVVEPLGGMLARFCSDETASQPVKAKMLVFECVVLQTSPNSVSHCWKRIE